MWQIMLHYKFRQLCTTEWWSWSKQLLPGEGRGKKIRWRKVTTIKTFSYSCFNHHFNLPATATAFTDLLVRLLSLPWNQHALTSVLIQTRRVFQSKPHFTSKSCHILISNALKYLTLFLPFWPMSSTIVFLIFIGTDSQALYYFWRSLFSEVLTWAVVVLWILHILSFTLSDVFNKYFWTYTMNYSHKGEWKCSMNSPLTERDINVISKTER